MSRDFLLSSFCAAGALLFGLPFHAAAAPPPSPATQTEALIADPEFAAFGLELPTLAGWHRIPETRNGMVARWTDEAADVKEPTHIISIALEPSQGRTAAKFVSTEVDQNGGQGASASVAMGGEKTYWIIGATTRGGANATLVAVHGKYVYLIDGLADTRQHLPATDMEKLAAALKFVNIESPSKAMRLRDEPWAMEHFSFKPLVAMRPGPEGESGGMIVLGNDNYAASQTEFVMSAQPMRIKPNETLDAVGNEFFQKITDGQAPVRTWGYIRTKPQRAISAPIPSSYQGQPVTMRIGVVQISDNEAAVLHFTITSPDAAVRDAYEKACEDMVRTVEPVAR